MAKQVDFEVRVIDADKAAQEFNKVDDSITSTRESIRASIPTLKAMDDAEQNITETTQGMSSMMIGLVGGLIGGGGLQLALSMIRNVIEDVTKSESESILETEKWATSFLNMKSAADQLNSTLGTITKQIKLLTDEQVKNKVAELESGLGGAKGFIRKSLAGHGIMTEEYGRDVQLLEMLKAQLEARKTPDRNQELGIIAGLREQIKLNKELKESAKTELDIKKYSDSIKQLEGQLNAYFPKADKLNKGLKEHKENLTALANPLQILINLYKKLNEQELSAGMVSLPRPGSFKMGTVPIPPKPLIEITDQEFAKQNEQWIEGILNTLDIMRSEFNQAWEDIFGEANSMFEKLIASWADVFFNAFSKNAMGWLLDLIPGGGVISDFLGLGKASANGGSQNIYLQVDKTVFAKVVVDANNRASKLRLQ